MEGGIFHVYARGNAKQAVYLDDVDRLTYLRLLGTTVTKRSWRCLAYCLMENHVHLLVETPNANLAVGMQWLHGIYARTFNERHGRVGHLFQGRYGAERIKTEGQLWAVLRYIGLNPVEAGLCERPGDWRWGSYAAMRTAAPAWLDIKRVYAFLAAAGGQPSLRYVELVDSDGH
jgi:putative transposase